MVLYAIVVVLLCVCDLVVCAEESRFSARGATDVKLHRSTVMIVQDYKQVDVICTGNLLSGWWVLTAARCVYDNVGNRLDKHIIKVYCGYSNAMEYVDSLPTMVRTQQRSVQWIEVHPNYECCGYDEDNLALLKLNSKLDEEQVRFVSLATQPLQLRSRHVCAVTGYGRDKGDSFSRFDDPQDKDHKRYYSKSAIKERDVRVTRRCPCLYTAQAKRQSRMVTAPLICEHVNHGPETIMHYAYADLGAGLMCAGKLYGVFSGVLNYTFYDTCGRQSAVSLRDVSCGQEAPRHTLVFTSLCLHLPWLSNVTSEVSMKQVRAGDCGKLSQYFGKFSKLKKRRQSLFSARREVDEPGGSVTLAPTLTLLLLIPTPVFLQ